MQYPFGTYVLAKPKGTIVKIEAESPAHIGPLKVLQRSAKSEPLKLGLSDEQIEAGWQIMKQPEAPKAAPVAAITPRSTKAPAAPEA